ncbi:MAG: hypothetical protein A2189_09225 [Paenibacillus sp. RIFOXYA1_FULL_44_5]|nr:MAG: hypothetical protein A2189_09225 [Paenibacillus sp. RIFOXYA1_FULL_44_5]
MMKSLNMKWMLVRYFLLSTVVVLAAAYLGWIYMAPQFSSIDMWLGFVGGLVLLGLFVGYWASVHFTRKVDMLHISILQLMKGNMSHRINGMEQDSFYRIFTDFNQMASSLEERIRILQKLGEENALLYTQSNESAVREERKRLARDLHDSVSQQLFAMHMSASSLPKLIEQNKPELVQAVLKQVIEMSVLAQRHIRGFIAQLRPLELEGKHLTEALDQWFPDYCRQNGLRGVLDIQLHEGLSDGIEQQIFLIIQESMANVVKHANAEQVTLSLHDIGHQLLLNISDNGKGFRIQDVKTGSYGMYTMRERAQKLGGDMEVISNAGRGTRIKVMIPRFHDSEALDSGQ